MSAAFHRGRCALLTLTLYGAFVPYAPLPALGAEPRSDHDLILGGWKITSSQYGDSKDRNPAYSKVTFTKSELFIQPLPPCYYKLDSTRAPKRIARGVSDDQLDMFGIYRLDGDVLSLCYAPNGDLPYPPDFAVSTTEADYELIVCKRLPNVATLPDVQLPEGITALLDELIGHLESGAIEKCVERALIPHRTEAYTEQRRKELNRYFSRFQVEALSSFKAMKKVQPTITRSNSSADFDLTEVHIDDAPNSHAVALVKVGRTWYLK